MLPKRAILRDTMSSRTSANTAVITRIPAHGLTLAHCSAAMLLPSGLVALPFHTSPRKAMLASLA